MKALIPAAYGRALWVEQFIEEDSQNQHGCVDKQKLLFPNSNEENHGINSRFTCHSSNGERNFPKKFALVKASCNSVSNRNYMLPFDDQIKGMVLHVDREEKCLFVRPQILDEAFTVLEKNLFGIQRMTLQRPGPGRITIGKQLAFYQHQFSQVTLNFLVLGRRQSFN
ncbi:unnamed protein product [Gongylonema pulchrum]|uniref:Uncharacterized protein n=1 Tax=Gongylonema pulchrum TaxID=637853 RepID=A0A183D0S3_9BILA|nr:unnamed protein product [Gongylonema pulchrum]